MYLKRNRKEKMTNNLTIIGKYFWQITKNLELTLILEFEFLILGQIVLCSFLKYVV